MPNYRSLVGGFFSADPANKSVPVSIRCNNPGAVNGASWERAMPGYVDTVETTPGNKTTIFETPEHGVAVWYELMKRYRAAGAVTVLQIITRYGGGQDYAAYIGQVVKWSGLQAYDEIKLSGDDATLLLFAKAMFCYEAGRATPLSDKQIRYGFDLARGTLAAAGPTTPAPAPKTGWLDELFDAIGHLVSRKPDTALAKPDGALDDAPIRKGEISARVEAIQRALIAAGAELNPDGEFGTITEAAVQRFQAAHGLPVTGVVNAATGLALTRVVPPATIIVKPPLPSVLKVAPHLATMRAITGTKEVPGDADSPIILAWGEVIAKAFPEMRDYVRQYRHDATPWCGWTIAYCLAANVLRPVFGKTDVLRFMWADAWGHEGPELIKLKPPYPVGSILTFTRAGGGHVALLEGETDDTFIIRGGNQSDMVNVVSKGKAQFTAATWPRALPLPAYVKPPTTLAGVTAAPRAGKEA